MKRWLLLFALIAACSGRDQSLGETLRPRPIIIDPTPESGSGSGAASGSGGTGATSGSSSSGSDSGGSSTSGTGSGPSTPPCEDHTKHAFPGRCLPLGSCVNGTVLTGSGYECAPNELCCDDPPGCGQSGCGNPNQGGNGNDADAGAGAGGN
jgi:hypothetical protein